MILEGARWPRSVRRTVSLTLAAGALVIAGGAWHFGNIGRTGVVAPLLFGAALAGLAACLVGFGVGAWGVIRTRVDADGIAHLTVQSWFVPWADVERVRVSWGRQLVTLLVFTRARRYPYQFACHPNQVDELRRLAAGHGVVIGGDEGRQALVTSRAHQGTLAPLLRRAALVLVPMLAIVGLYSLVRGNLAGKLLVQLLVLWAVMFGISLALRPRRYDVSADDVGLCVTDVDRHGVARRHTPWAWSDIARLRLTNDARGSWLRIDSDFDVLGTSRMRTLAAPIPIDPHAAAPLQALAQAHGVQVVASGGSGPGR